MKTSSATNAPAASHCRRSTIRKAKKTKKQRIGSKSEPVIMSQMAATAWWSRPSGVRSTRCSGGDGAVKGHPTELERRYDRGQDDPEEKIGGLPGSPSIAWCNGPSDLGLRPTPAHPR